MRKIKDTRPWHPRDRNAAALADPRFARKVISGSKKRLVLAELDRDADEQLEECD